MAPGVVSRPSVELGEQPLGVPTAPTRQRPLATGRATPHADRARPEVESGLQALTPHRAAGAERHRLVVRPATRRQERLGIGARARGLSTPALVGHADAREGVKVSREPW
jgi:hypothetical protein